MVKPLITNERILLCLQVSQLTQCTERMGHARKTSKQYFLLSTPCICTVYNLAAHFKTLLRK